MLDVGTLESQSVKTNDSASFSTVTTSEILLGNSNDNEQLITSVVLLRRMDIICLRKLWPYRS
jgi:hypothetical protein